MEEVIQVRDLVRTYKKKRGFFIRKIEKIEAVRGITFSVNKGEIFGILGENGAGKTTTIKIMITLLAPTAGVCKVLGYDTYDQAQFVREHINFIFGGEMGVYRRLSARDNLIYFAGLYKVNRKDALVLTEQLLELVGLEQDADRLVETYSKGMIQRLQIARGLVNNPDIIFMDEPTVGLDPMGARMLRNVIRELKEQGKTVVLTTHYMNEADELCDRVAIMNKGKILKLDTPESIKNGYCESNSLEDAFINIISSDRREKG